MAAHHPVDVVESHLPTQVLALAPMTRWQKRRSLAGQVLEFSAQLVRPDASPLAGPRSRIEQLVGLAGHLLPKSIESHRSLWSSHSMYSGLSIYSFGSFGSVASAFSAGSILSIGSTGSILSIGSAGSILSIGSAGSVLGIGALGQRTIPVAGTDANGDAGPRVSSAAVTRIVQLGATAAATGALAAVALRR